MAVAPPPGYHCARTHAPPVMTFAHLTLATRDVQRTALFFERTLGWPRVAAPDNTPLDAAWVQMGKDTRQQVHILRVADFEPSPFEAEFGRHFAVFRSEERRVGKECRSWWPADT